VSDPRNPKRPDGPDGDSWAICRGCMRGAPHVNAIRHAKKCRGRSVFTVHGVDMKGGEPARITNPTTLQRIAEGLRRYRGHRS